MFVANCTDEPVTYTEEPPIHPPKLGKHSVTEDDKIQKSVGFYDKDGKLLDKVLKVPKQQEWVALLHKKNGKYKAKLFKL